ncbi:carbohydrate esterase family 1 protein [Obelidium mucronatum]|nr:carbohydrate esterase family 1 protein [Obelidium mucronatum]
MELVSSSKVAGGTVSKYRLVSARSLGGLSTLVNVFVPPGAGAGAATPGVVVLAGLTCSEDTAAHKGGFFGAAAARGLGLVFPDTSPRGAGVAGESAAWDFGVGAGFYLDATAAAFSTHYNMEAFVVRDLVAALAATEGVHIDTARLGITGHSMGGHGSLTLYLKHQNLFHCASAFAPICNPTKCPWGVKAFTGYLAGGVEEGKAHDATELIAKVAANPNRKKLAILIDSGLADSFYLQKQLLPENFEEACRTGGIGSDEVSINLREGYDHSYYFVSTFAEDHMQFHASHLLKL